MPVHGIRRKEENTLFVLLCMRCAFGAGTVLYLLHAYMPGQSGYLVPPYCSTSTTVNTIVTQLNFIVYEFMRKAFG